MTLAATEPTTSTAAPQPLTQSLLTLHQSHGLVRAAIADVHHLHRTVMDGYQHHIPDHDTAQPRALLNVLYTCRTNTDGTINILTQSPHSPNWFALANTGALAATPQQWTTPTTFAEGQSLQFQLTANPSRRSAHTKRRRSIAGRDEQLAWLQRRGTHAGFTIAQADTAQLPAVRSHTKSKPAEQRDTTADIFAINPVQYRGILTVTDPIKLAHSILAGIGPAKAYGCGLLLLR